MKYQYYKFMSFFYLKVSRWTMGTGKAIYFLNKSIKYFGLAIDEATK